MDHSLARTWQESARFGRYVWRCHRRAILGVVIRRQTYHNIAYLLLSFPLGVAYVSFLITGLIVGLALLPVLIGFPILLLMVAAAWWLGSFERRLARSMLQVEIPSAVQVAATDQSPQKRLAAHLRDQVTWTNLLYLVLKFPLGIVSLAAVAGVIALTVELLISLPRSFQPGPLSLLFGPIPGLGGPIFGLLGIAVRVGLVLACIHGLNGLAYASGRFARVMLGPSDAALRVAESEAVAERERINAERAEQSRRELIVNVSHELRTPTASIRGHVESLLMNLDESGPSANGTAPDQLLTYLGIIHRETERLNTLVDELLALARSEAGELRLDLRPIKAESVIAEVHETLAPLAWRERSVTLIKEGVSDLPPVLADRERLTQVVLNLVRNAITHTPAGGIVSVMLECENESHVVLSVADTGSGIPQDDLERIFERFYRVDASRNRASGGFGLGLAIARDLVTAMGGTITAESVLNEGSCFRVRLRTAPPAVKSEMNGASEAAWPSSSSSKTTSTSAT